MLRKGSILFFAALLGSQASAQDRTFAAWSPTAYVEIVPSDKPGVWAEVVFRNDTYHKREKEILFLSYQGVPITVQIDAILDSRPETMTVTVPIGFLVVEPSISVEEKETGVVLIYPPIG